MIRCHTPLPWSTDPTVILHCHTPPWGGKNQGDRRLTSLTLLTFCPTHGREKKSRISLREKTLITLITLTIRKPDPNRTLGALFEINPSNTEPNTLKTHFRACYAHVSFSQGVRRIHRTLDRTLDRTPCQTRTGPRPDLLDNLYALHTKRKIRLLPIVQLK